MTKDAVYLSRERRRRGAGDGSGGLSSASPATWQRPAPIAMRIKKREEKSNSPPGLKFGFWPRKLFGAVKRTNELVLLFLR
jgi:hypothetical protein